MAFQPVVDVSTERVFAYEALVRGPKGESAYSVLSQVTDENRYAFDQSCRVCAITLAERLGIVQTGAMLSINFMPGAVYSPAACIQLTLQTARRTGFPLDRLLFEVTEAEEVKDPRHLSDIVSEYRKHGFKVAIDDFGEGYSGLRLLSEFSCDVLKLDMSLTRNLDQRPAARAIVDSLVQLGQSLGTKIVAEGVETGAEYAALRDAGIKLMQGYLLARPAFEALPPFDIPRGTTALPSVTLHHVTRVPTLIEAS